MLDSTETQTDEMQALTNHQIELERLYAKNQLIPRIRAEFQGCKEFDFSAYMVEKDIPVMFGFDLLVQMALHKRATLPTLVGILRHHFDSSQICADMLLRAAEADLVDWSPSLRLFVVKFTMTDDVQEELDRFQFPLPMVVEPQSLKSNRDTGYLLRGTGSSVILRNNHHEGDVCLDHLDRMNRVALSINWDVATMIKNRWRNLDKAKEGETRQEFEQRKRAFEKYDRTAKDVMTKLTERGNRFFLTHRYDKRGRTYAMGYHVTTQGNAWNKAVIEFADKEIVR